MSLKKKKELIAHHFQKILETLELDLPDAPTRVATMYVDEIFTGLNPLTFPDTPLLDEPDYHDLVEIKNISVVSFCEHHFVPMVGVAHIAYYPKKGLLGLSTIHRIVRHFAKRPQLQERLTQQISTSLQEALHTEDVSVTLRLTHFCVRARGVEDQQSEVETQVLCGCFKKFGRECKPDSVPAETGQSFL